MNVCASFDALAIFVAHLEPFRPYQRKVSKIAVVPKGNPHFWAKNHKKITFRAGTWTHSPDFAIFGFSPKPKDLWASFGTLAIFVAHRDPFH